MVIRCAVLILSFLLALPAAAQEMRLQILHDHASHVVGEMIPLTIRAEYDATVNLSELTFPDAPGYDWIQLTRDDWYKERISGREWQIFQRKIAVFPREAGPLTVGPVTHMLQITGSDNRWHEVQVEAPEITIDVQPFPGGFAPLSARRLTLTDELSADPGKLIDGEVLIRRVTLQALGALPHQLPPRPDLREPWLISFTEPEQRSVEPTPDGPVSTVVWEWSLQPHTGEPSVLKAFAFPWMDTDTRQIEIAAMKPIPFGFASFASNIADASRPQTRNRLIGAGLLGLGLIGGLAAALLGRGLQPPDAVMRQVRRWRFSPHVAAMRRAAREGRLPELRRAAVAHLRLRGHQGRGAAVLTPLDRQLYTADPPGGFDAKAFVRQVIAQGRLRPDQSADGSATRWSISNTSPNRAASNITTD
ncbi:BatD family protein [Paracoccus tegillarcae]|uniref:Protein BatD n=1 Tax=Paracoccus tegillarcae TaxID=1529068 RepID=A0A2K9ENK1_9RHOB|nr:BatD family protein [Paracoccus tegillarcae]AUH35047.1 hypothetical protein CUV01_18185 [Paracoccus tegillarcae]